MHLVELEELLDGLKCLPVLFLNDARFNKLLFLLAFFQLLD